ncbi:TorF family putative porin [Rhodanobacter sp. AS-Z3]|uniref:TorF family putative porin n=1 Tax=Rhodanobacter sp. AS-Z3 TaxID=3031330 RepID=UPI0031F300EC
MASVKLPALAGDTPTSGWVGNAGAVSDYLFRGLSQTNRKPAVQAGIEFDHARGWHVGGWGSTVSWLSDASTSAAPTSSRVELDVYGGYRGSFATERSYDLGAYRYQYPGSYPTGFTLPNTSEIYAALAWKSLSLKYSYALTHLFGYADSEHSGYLDLTWNQPLAPGAGSSMRTSVTSKWRTSPVPRTAPGSSASRAASAGSGRRRWATTTPARAARFATMHTATTSVAPRWC